MFLFTDGGFIYIQNAQPNGPSVWIFLEATDRLLRHAADDWTWMMSSGLRKCCNCLDQEMLEEVLGSVVAGRPIWRGSLMGCAEEKTEDLGRKQAAVDLYINWGEKLKVGDPLLDP